MKNIYRKFNIALALIVLYSCSESNTVDEVMDNLGSGGILRTIEVLSSEIALGSENAQFSVILEAQDNQNGNLLDKVEVYGSFIDNTADDVNNNVDELFLFNIPRATFETGPIGLPRTTLNVTLTQLLSSLNLTNDQYNGGDQFVIRLKYVMTDGRVFSWENSGNNILGGAYFRSPFRYFVNVTCPFTESLAGTHNFETFNMSRPGASPCGGTVTGTVTFFDTDESGNPLPEGTYRISDLSFGLFESSCWFDDPAFDDGARVKWFCSSLLTLGTDQYGETWEYTITNVSGSQMTIDFESTYGETGTTILTRANNQAWPAIFQN